MKHLFFIISFLAMVLSAAGQTFNFTVREYRDLSGVEKLDCKTTIFLSATRIDVTEMDANGDVQLVWSDDIKRVTIQDDVVLYYSETATWTHGRSEVGYVKYEPIAGAVIIYHNWRDKSN